MKVRRGWCRNMKVRRGWCRNHTRRWHMERHGGRNNSSDQEEKARHRGVPRRQSPVRRGRFLESASSALRFPL
jgi:hypothetical protein